MDDEYKEVQIGPNTISIPEKWKRYPKYKDSGMEWIEEIPEGWDVRKLKNIAYMKGRIGWQGLKQSEFTDEGPYLITGMNFKDGVIRWDEVYHITEERYNEAPEIHLRENDVLMTKDGTIGKLLYVDNLPGKASLNSHLLVIRPLHNDFLPKFLYYQLQSYMFQVHIEIYKTGTTFFGLTQEGAGIYKMILPSLKQQQSIISFIDRRTHLIDTLIAKKQLQVELLREMRAALITRAVTKGLDPGVKMKDSGIEWLGEIPEGWGVVRLKYIAFLKSGESITTNEIIEDDEYPVYGGNGLRGCYHSFTHDGSFVLIGRQGALCGNVHYVSGKFWASEHAIVVQQIKPVSMIWLGEVLRTMNLNQYSISAAQPGLSVDKIKQLMIPIPPLSEQNRIAGYLENVIEKINELVINIENNVKLLEEYRSALITAAVTGKIDLREEANA